MDEKNLWTTFEKTGSIVDYLYYRGIHDTSEVEDLGENAVESDSYCDGNDFVAGTDWRV